MRQLTSEARPSGPPLNGLLGKPGTCSGRDPKARGTAAGPPPYTPASPYTPPMCGRFTLVRLADFLDEFPWILPPIAVPDGGGDGRYNIAPTQPVAAVLGADGGGPGDPRIEFLKWGLVPSWATDPAVGSKMINARAETLGERPAFKRLVGSRRCLIPADGFYEWHAAHPRGGKTAYFVRLKSGRPFALAGLWDTWRDRNTGHDLKTCTIITAEPNAVVAALHTRMAVIVKPDDYRQWLGGGPLSAEQLSAVLSPFPAEAMEAYPVSPAVNNVRADGPHLTLAAGPAPPRVVEQLSLF